MIDTIVTWGLLIYIAFNIEIAHSEEFDPYKVSQDSIENLILPVGVLAHHCDLGMNKEEIAKFITSSMDTDDPEVMAYLSLRMEDLNYWAISYKTEDTCIEVEQEYPELLYYDR